MNQILRHSDTELLLFLDADIKLGNALAITKMVRTFAHRPHILVAAAYQNPIPSDTLIGKINTTSFKVWYKLISSYRHGNNINCLMGSATMLRKSFYSQFHFPPLLICDQHYLYMSVIKVHRHSFCLVRGTNVLFHMVSTFKDSRLLGARSIYQDKMDLASRFGEEALREYAIPRSLKVQISMWAFMVMPWGFLGSIFLGLCIRAFPYYQKTQEALWIPLESSKGVIL